MCSADESGQAAAPSSLREQMHRLLQYVRLNANKGSMADSDASTLKTPAELGIGEADMPG